MSKLVFLLWHLNRRGFCSRARTPSSFTWRSSIFSTQISKSCLLRFFVNDVTNNVWTVSPSPWKKPQNNMKWDMISRLMVLFISPSLHAVLSYHFPHSLEALPGVIFTSDHSCLHITERREKTRESFQVYQIIIRWGVCNILSVAAYRGYPHFFYL